MIQSVQSIIDAIERGADGHTVDLNGFPLPTTGFYVGGACIPLVNPTCADAVYVWFSEHVDYARVTHLGMWRDPADGTIYVDAVNHVQPEWLGLALGRRRGEKAIFDIANQRDVTV